MSVRLIDGDWLHDALNDNFSGMGVLTLETVLQMIREADTIDPVHAAGGCYCRECRHTSFSADGDKRRCGRGILFAFVKEDDFCSYGEKGDTK